MQDIACLHIIFTSNIDYDFLINSIFSLFAILRDFQFVCFIFYLIKTEFMIIIYLYYTDNIS